MDRNKRLRHHEYMSQSPSKRGGNVPPKSLDSFPALPAHLLSADQVRDFIGSGVYEALQGIQDAILRLEKQGVLLLLEEAMDLHGLVHVQVWSDGFDDEKTVGVRGWDAQGKTVDNPEGVADEINGRMNPKLWSFVSSCLFRWRGGHEGRITLDDLHRVAENQVGFDFRAARQEAALQQELPEPHAKKTGVRKARM